jgi:putative PIN family toxin of toxin-antitoxin system
MPPIVVYDTNVLFSASGWRGRAHEAVELARSGAVEGLTCQPILDELFEKLQQKLGTSREDAERAVIDFSTFLRSVAVPGNLHGACADPDDDVILECGVTGGATHIVTGDRKHLLPLGSYQGVAIITAADLINLISSPP